MTKWRGHALVGLALLLSSGVVNGQSSNVQMLHRFAKGAMPSRPFAVVSLSGDNALVLAGGSADTSDGVLRVERTGAMARLSPLPSPFWTLLGTLVPGGDGRYYGLAGFIDDAPRGAVWSIDVRGGVATAYRFQGRGDGQYPYALFPGPGGVLYGASQTVDRFDESHVFSIDGTGAVTPAIAYVPAALAGVGPDGSLYGIASASCVVASCSVVRRSPAGELTTIISPLEDTAFRSLLPLSTETLLALTTRASSGTCDLVRIDQAASPTLETLATFDEPCTFSSRSLQTDGAPGAAVGFTERSVFRVNVAGAVTVLARLPARSNPLPAGVIDLHRASDGTIWIVTEGGEFGGGELYRVPASGAWTRALAFPGGNPTGATPVGPVVSDADGFVYGSAGNGGQYGRGTLFRVKKDGTRFQVLYTFTGGTDGGDPSPLVKTPDGALWGTTSSGGNHGGTVFRVGRSGALSTVFVFRRAEDGQSPGPVAIGRDGVLYGWTAAGGAFGQGTAFRVTPDGVVTVFHHFGETDGLRGLSRSAPFAAADGHLYGVASACSPLWCAGSTLFRMTVRGEVALLWRPSDEGTILSGPIVQTADGQLWGTLRFNGGFFASPPTGGGHAIATDRLVQLATVASDGTLYGFGAGLVEGGDDVVKLRPYGEVQRYAPVGLGRFAFSEGSLIDGRDGFLYGTASLDAETGLGAIFRVPGPGPSAPPNVRIVR